MFKKLALFTLILSALFWYLSLSGKLEPIIGTEINICSSAAGLIIEATVASYSAAHEFDDKQAKEFKTIFKREFCKCVEPLSKNKIQALKNRHESKTVIHNCSQRAIKQALEGVLTLFN